MCLESATGCDISFTALGLVKLVLPLGVPSLAQERSALPGRLRTHAVMSGRVPAQVYSQPTVMLVPPYMRRDASGTAACRLADELLRSKQKQSARAGCVQ